jgi:molecular chaperone HscB
MNSTHAAPSGDGSPPACNYCGHDLGNPLVCEACGRPCKLATALALDYFALLDLPRTYALTRPALEAAYLRASKRVHPDYHRERDEDHATSRRLTALLNEAYETLKDPFRRAAYLLACMTEGAGARPPRELPPSLDTKPSREFLMEQFELRERALEAGDDAARLEVRQQMESRLADTRTALIRRFAAIEGLQTNQAIALQELRLSLAEANYYRGLLRDIDKVNGQE